MNDVRPHVFNKGPLLNVHIQIRGLAVVVVVVGCITACVACLVVPCHTRPELTIARLSPSPPPSPPLPATHNQNSKSITIQFLYLHRKHTRPGLSVPRQFTRPHYIHKTLFPEQLITLHFKKKIPGPDL